MRALLLLLPLTACAAQPAISPANPPPPVRPPAPVVQAPEPEPPPQPLRFEHVRFDQKLTLASSGLGAINVRLLSEAELAKALPAHLRGAYLSVEKSYQAYRKLAATSHKSAAHRQSSTQARKSFLSTLARSLKTLRAELGKKPTGALGIATARLELWDSKRARPSFGRDVFYGSVEENADSQRAVAPLRSAVLATTVDQPIGRWARLELIHHLMATDDAPTARSLLAELLPASAPDLRPQLLFRLAILDSLAQNHSAAAAGFQRAHADLAVTSGVSRTALIRGELIANLQLQKFDAVLALAKQAFAEAESPTPLKPDPNPPPPPPPATKPKPGSKASRASMATLLGSFDPHDFGVLGALSYGSPRQRFTNSDTVQLAADAVERLGLKPETLDGPASLRAGILSRLAARAHYRGDDEAAKALALQAEALDQDESIDALRVLRVLAARAGEQDRVTELDRGIAQLRYLGGEGDGVEQDYLLAELRRQSSDSKTDPKLGSPTAERSVRSLLRVCLEPVRYQLPDDQEEEVLLSEVTLAAKIYPDGKVELEGPRFDWGGLEARHVETCLKSLAPRVLASATSSVRVSVAVKTTPQRRGLLGVGSIESFGGFGLRGSGIGSGIGSGGSVEGIGSGSIGKRGRGGGAIGGIGSRAGGGGSSKQPAKPKPKPKKQP